MNRLFLVVLFVNCFFAHAELAQDEYEIYDTCINETIRLGDRFSNILQMYPNIVFRGLKKYSNITHNNLSIMGFLSLFPPM